MAEILMADSREAGAREVTDPTLPTLRFPVTLLFALQYVALAAVPAILNQNAFTFFILLIVAVAVLASWCAEAGFEVVPWLTRRRRPIDSSPVTYPSSVAVWLVTLVGALAILSSVSLGVGTYATQVGLSEASPLASLTTPLVPWVVIGCAFGLARWRAGKMSRKQIVILIAVAMGAQLVAVLNISRTAPLMALALTLGSGLVLVGFVKARWLVVALVVALLVWPLLFSIRNAGRYAVAGVTDTSIGHDAESRVREDILLAQAPYYGHLSVLQPSPLEILRFGLVPRALDQGRGELPSGKLLNATIGGSSSSSNTFTTIGTIWSIDGGMPAVVAYAAIVASLFGMVIRRLTPVRLAIALLLVQNFVWIEAIFPDSLASVLQSLVSLLAATVVVAALRVGRSSEPEAQGSVRPPLQHA